MILHQMCNWQRLCRCSEWMEILLRGVLECQISKSQCQINVQDQMTKLRKIWSASPTSAVWMFLKGYKDFLLIFLKAQTSTNWIEPILLSGRREKADVVTTYPIDLVVAKPIIVACTWGKQHGWKMGSGTNIGPWLNPIEQSVAHANELLRGWEEQTKLEGWA